MIVEGLVPFTYGDRQVRVVMQNSEPWFVAKDVCESFGDTNYRRSVSRLDDDEKGVSPLHTLGGTQNMVIVNESGLYTLLFQMQPQHKNGINADQFQARKDALQKFKRWVTHEVLPSIRKTGSYQLTSQPSYTIEDPIARAERWIIEQKERLALQLDKSMLEQRVGELEPKATYLDLILKSTNTVTVTQIAKDYGLTGQALNAILHEEGLQYKINDQWLLYRAHHDKGYTRSMTMNVTHNNGETTVKMTTRWTQKGRLKIHEILTERGITAFADRKLSKEMGK